MDSFKESLMDYFINEYKEIIYCGRPYCKDCFPNQMWTNYCQGPIWLYCMDVCGLRLFYFVQKFVFLWLSLPGWAPGVPPTATPPT